MPDNHEIIKKAKRKSKRERKRKKGERRTKKEKTKIIVKTPNKRIHFEHFHIYVIKNG